MVLPPEGWTWALCARSLIWLVTIRYSRGLGESLFGPCDPTTVCPVRRNRLSGPHPECHTESHGWPLVAAALGRRGDRRRAVVTRMR